MPQRILSTMASKSHGFHHMHEVDGGLTTGSKVGSVVSNFQLGSGKVQWWWLLLEDRLHTWAQVNVMRCAWRFVGSTHSSDGGDWKRPNLQVGISSHGEAKGELSTGYRWRLVILLIWARKFLGRWGTGNWHKIAKECFLRSKPTFSRVTEACVFAQRDRFLSPSITCRMSIIKQSNVCFLLLNTK